MRRLFYRSENRRVRQVASLLAQALNNEGIPLALAELRLLFIQPPRKSVLGSDMVLVRCATAAEHSFYCRTLLVRGLFGVRNVA